MKTLPLLILLFALGLVGCRGSVSSDRPVHYVPHLDGFHVVDSYSNNTEDQVNPRLVLDPYIEDGEFEVYWYVDNVDDYTVELRVNDVASIRGSRRIASEYCGPGLDCDLDGILFCNYFADFSMSCDPPGTSNPNQYLTYFDDLMVTVPRTMYLILDVCDTQTDHCEYDVRAVSLE